MTMLIAVAASIIATDGLSNRFPQIAALEAKLGRPAMCDGCHIGAPGEPQLVLWGDSHAAAISPSIRDVAHREKIPGVAFTSPGCPPLIGAQPFTRDEPKSIRCRAFQEHALASIEALPRVTTIILAGRWALATETTRFGDETRGRSFLRDSKTDRNSVTESRRAFAEALPRTVRALTKDHPKARILLIGQVPEPGFDPAECMIRAMMFDRDLSKCATVKSASRDRLRFSDSLIEQFAADDPQVGAIMLDRLTCASERCQTMMGITPLYRDVDHLSREGAVAVLRKCLTVAVQNESGCPTAVIP
ncbi:MAG TPA: SGNH hydrolase domain-containing protein [Sphingomicrobium sp.]|nr:SGNH hydrolase domain-containing protein [Sphingomicrobium sp.]